MFNKIYNLCKEIFFSSLHNQILSHLEKKVVGNDERYYHC